MEFYFPLIVEHNDMTETDNDATRNATVDKTSHFTLNYNF